MTTYRFLRLLAAAVLFLPLACVAAKPDASRHLDASTQERFDDQAAAIRQEMRSGGRYEYLTGAERADVDRQLDAIAAIFGASAGAPLSEDQQLDLYAAQESANAVLTQKDGRRLICEYSAPTGSNRKLKQCISYAERMRAHKESQSAMRDNLHKNATDRRGPDS